MIFEILWHFYGNHPSTISMISCWWWRTKWKEQKRAEHWHFRSDYLICYSLAFGPKLNCLVVLAVLIVWFKLFGEIKLYACCWGKEQRQKKKKSDRTSSHQTINICFSVNFIIMNFIISIEDFHSVHNQMSFRFLFHSSITVGADQSIAWILCKHRCNSRGVCSVYVPS